MANIESNSIKRPTVAGKYDVLDAKPDSTGQWSRVLKNRPKGGQTYHLSQVNAIRSVKITTDV